MARAIPPNRIAEQRKKAGLTQQQLAEKVGSHWITISKLERNVMRLTDDWRDKIGTALGIDPWDLVSSARKLPVFHIEGRIFDDGSIDELDEGELASQLHTDFFTHPDYRWLEVGDNGLYPWYQPGDLICVLQVGSPKEIARHVGRLCVGWFKDAKGAEDVAIGFLEKGSRHDVHTIRRVGLPPIVDQEMTSFAVVAMSVFKIEAGKLLE